MKAQAAGYSATLYTSGEGEAAPVEAAEPVQSDPTITHAGLTEIDAGTDIPLTNGHVNETSEETAAVIPNTDAGDDAANAAGESQWDKDANNDLTTSQEWVEIQKPVETPQTETAPNAAPAAASNQSWADDHPEPSSGVCKFLLDLYMYVY